MTARSCRSSGKVPKAAARGAGDEAPPDDISRSLRAAFIRYCSLGDPSSSTLMSNAKFTRLVIDCQLLPVKEARIVSDIIFADVVRRQGGPATAKGRSSTSIKGRSASRHGTNNPVAGAVKQARRPSTPNSILIFPAARGQTRISYHQFLASLVEIALQRYPELPEAEAIRGTPSQRYLTPSQRSLQAAGQLLAECVLPACHRLGIEPERAQALDEEVEYLLGIDDGTSGYGKSLGPTPTAL